MNFTTLSTAVQERLLLITGDQAIGTSIGTIVNEAIHEIEMDHPNGWDWLRKAFQFPTVAATADYSYATIAAATTPALTGIAKIVELKLVIGNAGSSVYPLQRLSRIEADQLYPNLTNTTPEVYVTEGLAVTLIPTPNAVFTVTGTCIATEADISGTTAPIMPVTFHSMIVEKAVSIMARRLQNYPASKAAEDEYRAIRSKALQYSRPYVGAGRVRAEAAWERG